MMKRVVWLVKHTYYVHDIKYYIFQKICYVNATQLVVHSNFLKTTEKQQDKLFFELFKQAEWSNCD